MFTPQDWLLEVSLTAVKQNHSKYQAASTNLRIDNTAEIVFVVLTRRRQLFIMRFARSNYCAIHLPNEFFEKI